MDASGKSYEPLSNDELPPLLQSILAGMKPGMVAAAGPAGKNMAILVFSNRDTAGKPIADAKSSGTFSVVAAGKAFRWRTPLGALLPPKACPKCGESLSGAYKFCPYDGTPLPGVSTP
jgi:hypothetical protein